MNALWNSTKKVLSGIVAFIVLLLLGLGVTAVMYPVAMVIKHFTEV
jgi:hypothetical protein